MNNITFKEEEVRKTIYYLIDDKQPFEIRILKKGKYPLSLSGYFKTADDFLKALQDYDKTDYKNKLQGANYYIVFNILPGALMSASQANKFIESPSTTSDNDIILRKWLYIDIDRATKGKDKVSATDDEIEQVYSTCCDVYEYMKSKGFAEPITAFSGNGYHLFYKISLKPNDENKKLIDQVYEALALLFNNEHAEIDVSVKNLSRMCKLHGSLAIKGTNTKERPWRYSEIYDFSPKPDEIETNSKDVLEAVANDLPLPAKPQAYNNYSAEKFDLDKWITEHGINVTKTDTSANYTRYILECCPFDSSHTGKDAMITRGNNGALGFKCFHNSCADKKWADVRRLYEPDYQEKQAQKYDNYINRGYNRNNRQALREIPFCASKATPAKDNEKSFLTMLDILALPDLENDYIKTGINGIDKRIAGFVRGQLSVVTGLRSSGKSTLVGQMIADFTEKGLRTVLYSGELNAKKCFNWLCKQIAGKEYVIKSAEYDDIYHVDENVQKAIAVWASDKVHIYNNELGTKYKAISDEITGLTKEWNADIVIIDNLMSLDISDLDIDNQYEAQKKFMQSLVYMAQVLNCHVILVAHPRKTSDFLRIEDISGTGDIANRADNVFLVHRVNEHFQKQFKTEYNDNKLLDDERITNIIEVAKNRENGLQDVFIPLYFSAADKRLRNNLSEVKTYSWDKSNVTKNPFALAVDAFRADVVDTVGDWDE